MKTKDEEKIGVVQKRLSEFMEEFGWARYQECQEQGRPTFTPSQVVEVVDHDGSHMVFHSAFYCQHEDYFCVFTEHQGNHFYHKDDIMLYCYERKAVHVGELFRW